LHVDRSLSGEGTPWAARDPALDHEPEVAKFEGAVDATPIEPLQPGPISRALPLQQVPYDYLRIPTDEEVTLLAPVALSL
jgi:hypothetical protein